MAHRPKHKLVSEKQLAANRANAGRSSGPRSPDGKARSAQNARKHGFTAAHFAVVCHEDLHAVAHLKAVPFRGLPRMARQANTWSLFLRYQAQTERHCRLAVEEF